jgi:predicted acylesterase/phospholipase RssA
MAQQSPQAAGHGRTRSHTLHKTELDAGQTLQSKKVRGAARRVWGVRDFRACGSGPTQRAPRASPARSRHAHPLSCGPQIGVAISGGGVRSAGFGLGGLACLADMGITPTVISTVSGGGYVGTSVLAQMLFQVRAKRRSARCAARMRRLREAR